MAQNIQDLQKGQGKNISDLLGRLTNDFRRGGYMFSVRNEAWLREATIRAMEYIRTKDGARYRGALLLRLSRGEARAEVYLTASEPPKFRVVSSLKEEFVDSIDKTIVPKLKELVDMAVNKFLENSMRLMR